MKQNTLFDSTEKTIASFSGMKLFMLSHIVALVSVSFSTILLATWDLLDEVAFFWAVPLMGYDKKNNDSIRKIVKAVMYCFKNQFSRKKMLLKMAGFEKNKIINQEKW